MSAALSNVTRVTPRTKEGLALAHSRIAPFTMPRDEHREVT